MRYTVELTATAEKALRKLDKPIRRRILAALDQLADTPRPTGCLKLTNSDTWRIRAARHWRILYEIHDNQLLVLVIDVEHRAKAYQDKG